MKNYIVDANTLVAIQLNNPFDFLTHYNEMQEILADNQVGHTIHPGNLALELKYKQNRHCLSPIYAHQDNEKSYYNDELSSSVIDFGGWRPYPPTTIPALSDKILFKQFLQRNNLQTPEFSYDPQCLMSDVIIKRRKSSFSQHILGPFRSSSHVQLNFDNGEFFEKIILGKLVKVWFCEANPAALATRGMCELTGDGQSTIHQLLLKAILPEYQHKLDILAIKSVLAYYRRTLATVLTQTQTQLIDFRWKLSRIWLHTPDKAVLQTALHSKILQQLTTVGAAIWKNISNLAPKCFIYTVDGVIQQDGTIQFLEGNSCANVHPFVYHLMMNKVIEGLCQRKVSSNIPRHSLFDSSRVV